MTERALALREEAVAGNYFVSAYPPFSSWRPEHIPHLQAALQRPHARTPLGIYVHLPFCQKKCDYCYYLSYVNRPAQEVDRYIDSILKEAERYAEFPAMRERPIRFAYFGGGTPSTLAACQVRRLMLGLRECLDWSGIEEVTCEVAPKSATRSLLAALKDSGVTRVSMGVQSFHAEILKLNGRIHLPEDIRTAYTRIRETGFDWINLDLMVGLLGETAAHACASVRHAIALEPESITVYQTEIPFNTRLYKDWRDGKLPVDPVSWAEKRDRLDQAFLMLEDAGYRTVSAYNAVRDPQRHRFKYQECLWQGGDMLGLGVASFGYFDGVHFQNEATLEAYGKRLEQGGLAIRRARLLEPRELLIREFILQLKWGTVSLEPLRRRHGVDPSVAFAEPLNRLERERLLVQTADEVRLTRAGLLRADRLLPEFYLPEHRDMRYT